MGFGNLSKKLGGLSTLLCVLGLLVRCGGEDGPGLANMEYTPKIVPLIVTLDKEESDPQTTLTEEEDSRAARFIPEMDTGAALGFGTVDDTPSEATITLTNANSTYDITGITASGTTSTFFYKGTGVFPGTGGTCGTTILASASCTVKVVFAPKNNIYFRRTVRVFYTINGHARSKGLHMNGTGHASLDCIMGNAGFAGGTGSVGSPYQVATRAQFNNIFCNRSRHFILTANLNFSGKTFVPIGSDTAPFSGTLDGDGKSLSNMSLIDTETTASVGIFRKVTPATTISNLTVSSVTVRGGTGATGGLVGVTLPGSTIDNVTLSGEVVGRGDYVGGVVGNAYSTISDTSSSATVTGANYVGGVVGTNGGLTNDSSATGNVTGSGSYCGGLAGESGPISGSTASGDVVCGGSQVGGLVGSGTSITNSSASGDVTGSTVVGKLAGIVDNHVSGCSATGTLTGTGDGIGGIIGRVVGGVVSNSGTCSGSLFSAGSGTSGSPYQITLISEFPSIRCNLGAYYKLMNDLDIANGAFATIGTASSAFRGSFDGNGKTISNITLGDASTDAVGFFPNVSSGTVKNLTLDSVTITGRDYTGALVGTASSATLTGNTVTNSTINGDDYVGAIVGYITSGVATSNTVTSTDVTADSFVGGAIGLASGATLTSLTATLTDVTNSTGTYTGGLVGCLQNATLSSSSATGGAVSGTTTNMGGLVGYMYSGNPSIVNSWSSNTTSGGAYTGGLVGCAVVGFISNSYATGNVTSASASSGGLVGEMGNSVMITFSYSSGAVSSGSGGGLVGTNSLGGYANVIRSYWDTDLSGRNSSAGGTGKTTAQTQDQSTFAGWDFSNSWAITGGSAPTLTATAPSCTVGAGGFASGAGTSLSPYLISNKSQLLNVTCNLSKFFKLTANIDYGGEGTVPLGGSSSYFLGQFDGDGYTISNAVVNGYNFVGFFGRVNGTIKNVTFSNLAVVGRETVGGLAGYAESATIQNVVTSGSVAGAGYVGGLIGSIVNTSVTLAHSSSTVSGIKSGNVGGLLGYTSNSSTITKSYATGDVTSSSSNVGGLVGVSTNSTISDCYAQGNVSTTVSYSGGLIGLGSGGTISRSYSTGAATGTTSVGGLIGSHSGTTATGCFWDTDTSGNATSNLGTGKTTAQMKTATTFTGVSWNDTTIWNISDGSYPTLR